MSETVYYAIGDIHGEAARLGDLHERILSDAARLGVAPFIVHLGDLVDRGPDSRGVIERIMRLEARADCRVVTLKGNHEEMMLGAVAFGAMAEAQWARNGGDAAIDSYLRANGGEGDWRASVDKAHLAWMKALPPMWRDETRGLVFVHAGIDPRRFPNCPNEVKLWTRSRDFFQSETWPPRPELAGLTVVHGHTPTEDYQPDVSPRRINVDTGACFGGPLTCAVLAPGEAPRFLQT